MVQTGSSNLFKYLEILFLGALIIQNSVNLSGALISLLYTSSDCDTPIRSWLIIQTSVSFFTLLVYFFFRKIGFGLWLTWTIIWSILGLLWAFSNNSCKEDFTYGFTSTLIIIFISLFMILLVLIFSCISGIAIGVGFGLSKRYIEIDS